MNSSIESIVIILAVVCLLFSFAYIFGGNNDNKGKSDWRTSPFALIMVFICIIVGIIAMIISGGGYQWEPFHP